MTSKAWMKSRSSARVVGFATMVVVVIMVELLIRAGIINPFIVPLPSSILASIPRIIAEESVLHRFWQTTQEILWAGLLLSIFGIGFGALLYRFVLLRMACETWVAALAAAPIPFH